MYLSREQQFLLDMLQALGCMTKAQAARLLRRKFAISTEAMPHIVRQLRIHGKLRETGNVLHTALQYNVLVPRAVELMLAVFPSEVPTFVRAHRPYLLTAYSTERDLVLRIIDIPDGAEHERSVFLENESDELPALTILLLAREEQKNALRIRKDCLLAYPDTNGKWQITRLHGGAR